MQIDVFGTVCHFADDTRIDAIHVGLRHIRSGLRRIERDQQSTRGFRFEQDAATGRIDRIGSKTFRERDLARYEDLWKADFGRELSLGMAVLRARQGLSPGELDAILSAFNDPEIVREILETGDMDRPSALFRRLAVKPRVIRAAGILLKGGLRSFIT